jgi:hypothetical protein
MLGIGTYPDRHAMDAELYAYRGAYFRYHESYCGVQSICNQVHQKRLSFFQ